MSHVNTTPHYGLPIYGENDIINPLTDFNDANSAIDTALYEIADAQGSEASDISAINTFLGDKELETVAQDVTDAINEVNTAVGNADTAIGNVANDVVTLQTAVGNASSGLIHDVGELQTTVGSQGNSITALQGAVGDANSGLVKDVADLKTTVGDSNSGLVKDVSDMKTFNTGVEEAIGTMGNKTVYRKRLVADSVTIDSPTVLDATLTISYIDTLISLNAVMLTSAGNYITNFPYDSSDRAYVEVLSTGVQLLVVGKTINKYSVELIYTKS